MLTPVSQMEVGCSRGSGDWNQQPKPRSVEHPISLPYLQPSHKPRPPPQTPNPKSQIKHPSHWTVSSMEKLLRRSPCFPEEGGEKLESTRTLSQAKATRPCAGARLICKRAADHWNCPKMPWAPPAINPNANAMPRDKSLNNNWFMESVRLLSYGCM